MGQKLVIAFGVLHAVAARVVLAGHVVNVGFFKPLDRTVFKYRVSHLQHGFFLINARVGAPRQQPKPRSQTDVVLEIPAAHRPAPHNAHSMALKMPFMAFVLGVHEVNAHVEGFAKNVLGIDLALF